MQRLILVAIRGPATVARIATTGLRRMGAGAASLGLAMSSYAIARAGDGVCTMLAVEGGNQGQAIKWFLKSASSLLSITVSCLEHGKQMVSEGAWDGLIPQVQGILLRALFHSRPSEATPGLRARFPSLGDAEHSALVNRETRTASSIGDAQHVALLALSALYRIAQTTSPNRDACSTIDVALAETWAHDPSPSLQRAAMLLLSAYARLRPLDVLDRLLTVFANLAVKNLGSDDPLGFALAQKMLAHVLPAVVQHGAKAGIGSAHIVRLFSSLTGIVPSHRRQPVFAALLEALGVAAKHETATTPAKAPASPSGSEVDASTVDVDSMLDGKSKFAGIATAFLLAGYVSR